MKKKALSLALALVLCLGLLPVTASAAEAELPDWYFLFAIFKNVDADVKGGDEKIQHVIYSMTQDEIDTIYDRAEVFEVYMNQLGVMRAHVEVVEIDEAVTELKDSSSGSFLSSVQTAPLLEKKVDLDRYDHVTSIVNLNVYTNYGGKNSSDFENGNGHSCINCASVPRWMKGTNPWLPGYPVHEFLHFMERVNKKWGKEFDLHVIMSDYERVEEYEKGYTDVLLNRAKGTAGTGVHPAAWQYPPHVIRSLRETLREVTIPSDMTVIADKAFQFFSNLSNVNIHSGVTKIGVAAFEWCTSLTEVTIPSGVTSIGDWAFQGCSALTRVTIPDSVTEIGRVAFYHTGLTDVYYGGTEAQWKAIQIGANNEQLTRATIHYNSPVPSTPQPTTPSYQVSDWARDRVALAVSTGLAAGSLGSDYRVNITRAQFAATAVKLYEAMSGKTIAPVTENPFTDTTDPVILQAASMGFVSGVGNGKFSPDAMVTREQAAVMLSSVYTKLGGTLPAVEATTFADDGQVAAWSRNAVAFLSDKGIVSGVGENRFSPQGQASIEQALLIALKMFEDLK